MKCGIDPGRGKIGVAVVEDGYLLFSAIVPKGRQADIKHAIKTGDWELLARWTEEGDAVAVSGRKPDSILVGNGTSSDEILKLLEDIPGVESADEYGTTLEGRRFYWKLHPPKGLWRLVPTSLRTPPRDIDDLAAWSIVKNSGGDGK